VDAGDGSRLNIQSSLGGKPMASRDDGRDGPTAASLIRDAYLVREIDDCLALTD